MNTIDTAQTTGRMGALLHGRKTEDRRFIDEAYQRFLLGVVKCVQDGRDYLIRVRRVELDQSLSGGDEYKFTARIVLAYHGQAEVGDKCVIPDDAKVDYIYNGEGTPEHEWRYGERVYHDCGWVAPNGDLAYERVE